MRLLIQLLNILFFITVLCFHSSCDSKVDAPDKMFLYENAEALIVSETMKAQHYHIKEGRHLVFVFQRQGETFMDGLDYEPRFTETLLFEIDSDLSEFELRGTELERINCRYVWSVLTKIPRRESMPIVKGTIKGKKLKDNNWKLSVDIDTGFKFGGYLDKQSTRKFNFVKQVLSKKVPSN